MTPPREIAFSARNFTMISFCEKGVPMRSLLVCAAAALFLFGCATAQTDGASKKGGYSDGSRPTGPKEITITAKGGQLKLDEKDYLVREFDRNGDKKTDIVNVYKRNSAEKGAEADAEPQIFIKMMDLNLDGKYDVYRFYDESGAVAKEELDLDFDGKIETTDHYIGMNIVQKEIDSQFDEKSDLWKYFDEKGILIKLEEDQDGDGTIDYWEYYAGGVLERVEKDTDRDGRPDVFKKAGDLKFTTILRNDGQFGSGVGPQQPDNAAAPKKAEEKKVEEKKVEEKGTEQTVPSADTEKK